MSGASESTGFLISGFQAELFLWCWMVLALLYGTYRSFGAAEPDPIRPSGPEAR